jgi:hypothetical protein
MKYLILLLLLPGCYVSQNEQLREQNRVLTIKYHSVMREADLAEARLSEVMAELGKYPNAYCNLGTALQASCPKLEPKKCPCNSK